MIAVALVLALPALPALPIGLDVWPPSFLDGMGTLHVDGTPPAAASCGACHPRELEDWASSRHKASATNEIFLDGLAVEPHIRCVNCHAPFPEQARDLVRARGRNEAVPASSSAHEGITCAVCHVRDGVVLTAGDGAPYGHPLRKTPELREAAFCAACHEFSSHETIDGKTSLVDLPMQSTWSEWTRWRDAGGKETCQACHMPGGAHTFRGAHDIDLLKASLVVDVEGADVVLSSRGVGHLFPTGDVFRHLRVWAVIDGRRVEVARLHRKTGLVDDGGRMKQVVVEDTRLVPGEPRRVQLPPRATHVVVTYHMADDKAEVRARVSYDDLVQELVVLPVPSAR